MTLDAELARELATLETLGRRRELGPRDHSLLDFASNDYLGFANDPAIVAAASRALQYEGLGGRAARLLGGGGSSTVQLESEAAAWLGCEATLLFPSGYQANAGLITALCGPGDAILSDRLIHASLIDAARLARAKTYIYEHLDLADLEAKLIESADARRRIVLTEGTFSMDGDRAPLPELHALCQAHDAQLIVDEAHSVGILGPHGAGAWAEAIAHGSLDRTSGADHLCARVITCGKALGGSGALIAGSKVLCDHLMHRARSFIFTTAPSPAISAGLRAAITACKERPQLRARALSNARQLANSLDLPEPASIIIPYVIGAEDDAMRFASAIQSQGLDVRAVRPPTVPEGTCRLRIVCHASHTSHQIEALATAIRELQGTTAETKQDRTVQPTSDRQGTALFVTGTDTGIGKTVVSAILTAALNASYWKPVQTGDDRDRAEVERLTGSTTVPESFILPLPASPHAAAQDAGIEITMRELDLQLDEFRKHHDRIVVELAGGLMVPYGDGNLQVDWLRTSSQVTVLVARSGLGTLNHTLLSIEALNHRGIRPSAIFMVGAPHPSNLETLREATCLPIFEVPIFEPLNDRAITTWIDAHDLSPIRRSFDER